MGYIAEVSNASDGLGCGGSCGCRSCSAGTRLSEWYIKPEDANGEENDDEGDATRTPMAGVHPFEPLWPGARTFRTPPRR